MQVATGLLIAGVSTGFLSAVAGVLAYFTVPSHTEEAHRLMYWHMAIQATSLLLFAWPAWIRWRHSLILPTVTVRMVAFIAALLLTVGSAIGGYLVYHGGAGIDPRLLAPQVRQHSHAHGENHEHMDEQHTHDANHEH